MNDAMSTRAALEARIRSMVAEQLGRDVSDVTLQSRIVADLGADSLDVAELMLLLEEEIGTDIPDSTAMQLETVGDVVALADRIAEQKGAVTIESSPTAVGT